MSTRGSLDGAEYWVGDRKWIVHDEENEDGRSSWVECGECGGTESGGVGALADHECTED